jgi:hypothetical protein
MAEPADPSPPPRRLERDGDWGDAGGLPVRARPLAPAPASGAETFLGRQYRHAFYRAHDWLRDELAQISVLTEQVVAGQLAATDARARVQALALVRHQWGLAEFCATYCQILQSHHQREDVEMFGAVLDVEPALTEVVARLSAEHAVIASVLTRFDRVLVRMINESRNVEDGGRLPVASPALAELAAITAELTALLLSHLSYEEDELHDSLGRLRLPG